MTGSVANDIHEENKASVNEIQECSLISKQIGCLICWLLEPGSGYELGGLSMCGSVAAWQASVSCCRKVVKTFYPQTMQSKTSVRKVTGPINPF